MQTRKISKADFDVVVAVIDRWWGGPISTLAHPIFFYELGDLAHVVEHDGEIIGFLLGFMAHPEGADKLGYVHLCGIHPDHRRKGVGRMLYDGFERACREAGCKRMKAITTSANEASMRFHTGQGWHGDEVEDYAGPHRKRVVFMKELA